MSKATISRQMSKTLAAVILPDIKAYILAHQKEFEKFAAEERQKMSAQQPKRRQSKKEQAAA